MNHSQHQHNKHSLFSAKLMLTQNNTQTLKVKSIFVSFITSTFQLFSSSLPGKMWMLFLYTVSLILLPGIWKRQEMMTLLNHFFVSSPEPLQGASQQRQSRVQPAEMAPGSEAPHSRLTQQGHWSHLHPLFWWIHWTLSCRRDVWGAESLSQCTPVAHNGDWCWQVKYSHQSQNVVDFWSVEMRTGEFRTAGWCLCPQSHVGAVSYLVTLGQTWCKAGRMLHLLLWLLRNSGTYSGDKQVAERENEEHQKE